MSLARFDCHSKSSSLRCLRTKDVSLRLLDLSLATVVDSTAEMEELKPEGGAIFSRSYQHHDGRPHVSSGDVGHL
jgi:hypothetical protein